MMTGLLQRTCIALLSGVLANVALADLPNVSFPSIDGGMLSMNEWEGQPILVVNTASQCAFTGQYDGLQELYDTYRSRGLVVLAIPSDDFNQELDGAEAVKEFCELNFAIDLPMTEILPVRGKKAHPFYAEINARTGFEPKWNFNKVLLGRDGEVISTWGSNARPMSRRIINAIESAL